MTITELISNLRKMIADGVVAPDSEVTLTHYGDDRWKDYNLNRIDWIWSDPIDEDGTKKIVTLIAE